MIRNLITLTENGTFAPVETVKIGYNDQPTRFNLVVVDGSDVVDTVTDHYELISNEMLIDSIDRAAEIVGLPALTAGSESYLNTKNGDSKITLALDDGGIQVPGDSSKTMREMLVSNNYAGRGSFGIEGGLKRMVCSNGMTVFDTAAEIKKMHIGVDDLDEWAIEALSIFTAKQSVTDVLTEILADSEWSKIRHGDALVETAPKRYRERLTEAVNANLNDMGFNGWAAAQAVTEVATHDMKGTPTAAKWSDKAIEKVLADIGRTWGEIEAIAATR